MFLKIRLFFYNIRQGIRLLSSFKIVFLLSMIYENVVVTPLLLWLFFFTHTFFLFFIVYFNWSDNVMAFHTTWSHDTSNLFCFVFIRNDRRDTSNTLWGVRQQFIICAYWFWNVNVGQYIITQFQTDPRKEPRSEQTLTPSEQY